ncbi:hypothetical protein AB0N24_16300 [Arthrobacter sp. NPDC093128]|uniref:hypothetical protein n=1 Tax=Arthrobacter sp. NPDC093128 TaxID=3154979 RepID=UPI00343A2829
MKTPRLLPEELQGRPFTVVDAARAGVSHKRLRHRSLHRLGKGIRSASSTADLPLSIRVRPFIEVNERCAASHLTAAELLVLPRRQQKGSPDMFHVIRPEGEAHLNRPHVIVHRMKLFSDEVTTVNGIPMPTAERTWLDMAEMLSLDELVAMGARHHEPDLSYRRYKVGIEYEGEHHGDEGQVVRDIARSERYEALGWTEVRISKRHMFNDAKPAVAKIRTAFVQAGWRRGH